MSVPVVDLSPKYPEDLRSAIVELMAGAEDDPRYARRLQSLMAGPGSRLEGFVQRLVPEIRARCGDLSGMRILDFGCGTGPSTIALASEGGEVVGFDVDASHVEVGRRRMEVHGLADRVTLVSGASIEEVGTDVGTFDLVVMNGVVEHVPLSIDGLRARVLVSAAGVVRSGGSLFVTETPNRLHPYDMHTTRLWFGPWTRSGSRWTYRRAVARGRHTPGQAGTSDGPRGLEERGAWGSTYWSIARAVRSLGFRCANHDRGGAIALARPAGGRRRVAEVVAYHGLTRWTGAPATAVWPFLTNLHFVRDDTATTTEEIR